MSDAHHLSDVRRAEEGQAFPSVPEPQIDQINALEAAPLRTMREIAEQVASKWDLTLAELKGPSRQRHIAHPRQEAMYLMRQVCLSDGSQRFSQPTIGRFFGGRDHTTVMHGVKAHARRLAEGRGE